MGFSSLISSAMGGFSSNIMSIATADKRAKQVRDQYEQQAKLAEYNRQLAQNQAIEARNMQQEALNQATLAEKASKTKRGQVSDANQALREKQLAIMAKSGVSSAGTPILVQEDQLAEMKLKENDVLYEGYLQSRQKQMEGRKFGIQGQYYDSQARMAQYQADVARSIGDYRSDMIGFQKKLTIAKMFYDPSNVTSFGEADNPQQFQHFNTGTLGAIGGSSVSSGAKLEDIGGSTGGGAAGGAASWNSGNSSLVGGTAGASMRLVNQ